MAIAAAMAVGRPIIATRVGGIPMMVKHGVNGYLFDVGDIDMLSRRLIELLSNKNKMIEFGKQSRRIAESRFASETVAEKTINVYHKLLSRKTLRGN
jgi:glycosyltransferase involved in cell wall biosynthesis